MRAKTDKADARMLALRGAAFELEPDAPMSQSLRDLEALRIGCNALVRDRTRLKNRFHALTLACTVKQTKARLEPLGSVDAYLCHAVGAGRTCR